MVGDLRPRRIYGSLGAMHPRQQRNHRLHRFIHFCTVHGHVTNKQAGGDRPTHRRQVIRSNRPRLASTNCGAGKNGTSHNSGQVFTVQYNENNMPTDCLCYGEVNSIQYHGSSPRCVYTVGHHDYCRLYCRHYRQNCRV